ncbi:hypothetical protein [Nocardia farcinica]|nr:hypothetical protein [Nocardia farcinica]
MATRGWFNHYDDPDEYWDDEPLIAAPATPRQMPPPRLRDSDLIQAA